MSAWLGRKGGKKYCLLAWLSGWDRRQNGRKPERVGYLKRVGKFEGGPRRMGRELPGEGVRIAEELRPLLRPQTMGLSWLASASSSAQQCRWQAEGCEENENGREAGVGGVREKRELGWWGPAMRCQGVRRRREGDARVAGRAERERRRDFSD